MNVKSMVKADLLYREMTEERSGPSGFFSNDERLAALKHTAPKSQASSEMKIKKSKSENLVLGAPVPTWNRIRSFERNAKK